MTTGANRFRALQVKFQGSDLFLALVVTFLLIGGCSMPRSSMNSMGPTSAFVFVANSGSGTVSAFAMNTSGALMPVAGSPFPAGAGAEFMAVDSAHKFLYVSNQ